MADDRDRVDPLTRVHLSGSPEQRLRLSLLHELGWTFLYWTEIPYMIAVVESPHGKIAYVDRDGNVLRRGKDPWRRRKPHLWRIRKQDFKDRLIERNWIMTGGYWEKGLADDLLIVRILMEEQNYFLCKFQFKSDFREQTRIERKDKNPTNSRGGR